MRPWVKRPADLAAHPAFRRIQPRDYRLTFSCLFDAANRRPPLIGWLIDDRDRPLSVREIARLADLSKSAAHRHLRGLYGRGILEKDLGGRLFIPLVMEIEKRFAGKTTTPSPTTTTPRTAVENPSEARPPPDEGVPILGGLLAEAGQSGDPLLYAFESEITTTAEGASSFQQPPPRPMDWSLAGDVLMLVPEAVENPIVRGNLAKLAAAFHPWRRVLEQPRDRKLIARFARECPAALAAAVEQARGEPQIRNAGAWLGSTVPAIASSDQAVSA